MQTDALQTPVAFFIFRRPDTTRRVFQAIAKAQPSRLLLVADGARADREAEAEACRQVIDIVSQVNWPCEVTQNFSQKNLGCRERMISGISWVFSLVEEAIILEDDCLPDPSFFRYCQELLDRYRDDGRIAFISGCNMVEKSTKITDSYFFSQTAGIWGWATWRSKWSLYDRRLSDWPKLKQEDILAELLERPEFVTFWTEIFDTMHDGTGPDTWDYQWVYTLFKHGLLSIVPRVNLVANIGFGEGATHTVQVDSRFMGSSRSMEFPLKHPASFIPMRRLDRLRFEGMLPPSIPRRIANRVHQVTNKLFH